MAQYGYDNTSRVFVFTLPLTKKLNPNSVTLKLWSLRNFVQISFFFTLTESKELKKIQILSRLSGTE